MCIPIFGLGILKHHGQGFGKQFKILIGLLACQIVRRGELKLRPANSKNFKDIICAYWSVIDPQNLMTVNTGYTSKLYLFVNVRLYIKHKNLKSVTLTNFKVLSQLVLTAFGLTKQISNKTPIFPGTLFKKIRMHNFLTKTKD